MSRRLFILISAAFLVGGAVALGFFALNTPQAPQPQLVSGKALIGGPFALTDHNGKRVTDKDFGGKHKLVFFGYTYCPDICPAELQVMSAAMDNLGDKAKDVTPVFITVDPERDTVEQMKSYVENFHPSLVGLTGQPGRDSQGGEGVSGVLQEDAQRERVRLSGGPLQHRLSDEPGWRISGALRLRHRPRKDGGGHTKIPLISGRAAALVPGA